MLFRRVSDPAEQVYAIKCTQLCHCSVGSDTPQDLVLRGLIPGRVLFCRVIPQDFVPWGIRPRWQIKTPQNQTKNWELAIHFKGHFLKFGCMYKLHYPRHIGFMLKEPFIWFFFVFVPRGLEIRIFPIIRTRIRKCFRVWIRGPYGVDSWKKTRGQKPRATVPLSLSYLVRPLLPQFLDQKVLQGTLSWDFRTVIIFCT